MSVSLEGSERYLSMRSESVHKWHSKGMWRQLTANPKTKCSGPQTLVTPRCSHPCNQSRLQLLLWALSRTRTHYSLHKTAMEHRVMVT